MKWVLAIFFRAGKGLLKGDGQGGSTAPRRGYQDRRIRLADRHAELSADERWCARNTKDLSGRRIARIFFYVDRHQRMVPLHGIIKKTRKTPADDLDFSKSLQAQTRKGVSDETENGERAH
jgi:hypothetical protein